MGEPMAARLVHAGFGVVSSVNRGRPHTAVGGRAPAEAHRGLTGIPQNREFPQLWGRRLRREQPME